jgi:hypothetical protein
MRLFIILFAVLLTSSACGQVNWWEKGTESTESSSEENPASGEEVVNSDAVTEEVPTIEEEPTLEQEYVEDSIVEPGTFEKGDIHVEKSSSINKVIKYKSAIISPDMGPRMEGYRIQLFFDQDREDVDEAHGEILKIDSESSTYIEYQAPNYNLLLGDFRSRLDAEKKRAELLSEFPEAIIVKDRIYLPKIKEEKEKEEK